MTSHDKPAGSQPQSGTQPHDEAQPTNANFNDKERSSDFPINKDMEDSDLAKALELSLTQQREQKQAQGKGSEANFLHEQSLEMMILLQLCLSNDFTPISDPDGDTLVYIGVPPKIQGQSEADYSYIERHFNKMHRMQSRKFLQFDSPKLQQLFRPNASIRSEKKFKRLAAYERIPGEVKDEIKYHIDLRPPSEDEEAVILVTDLSCSNGIRQWHLAREKYGLQMTNVMGTDDFDTPSNPYYVNACPPDVAHLDTSDKDAADQPSQPAQPQNPTPPEYTALRHHSALERLLHAINGDDPKLDSAPKMWTYFSLARYFGIAYHTSISWWIVRWFNEPNNSFFLQSNPEVSYRVGLDCRFPNLTRDSFAVLVGEKALVDVCSELKGAVSQADVSRHGRRLENLDDDERNRVGHAAASLIRRIKECFAHVVTNLEWLGDCHEYSKLLKLPRDVPEDSEIISVAEQTIRNHVKGKLGAVAHKPMNKACVDLDQKASDTHVFRHDAERLDFKRTYNGLDSAARIFTRSYWIALSNLEFDNGMYNVYTPELADFDDLVGGPTSAPYSELPIVRYEDLLSDISKLNALMAKRNDDAIASTVGQPQAQRSTCVTVTQQPDFGTVGPPIEASNYSKRVSFAPDQLQDSPGKRRRISESGEQRWPFTLPMRPLRQSEGDSLGNQTLSTQPTALDVPHGAMTAHQLSNRTQMTRPYDDLWCRSGCADTIQSNTLPTMPGAFPSDAAQKVDTALAKSGVSLPWPESGDAAPHLSADGTSKTLMQCFGCRYEQQFHVCSDGRYKLNATCHLCYGQPKHRCRDKIVKLGVFCGACFEDHSDQFTQHSVGSPNTSPRHHQDMKQSFVTTPPTNAPISPNVFCKPAFPPRYFKFNALMQEIRTVVQRKCQEIVWPAHLFHADDSCPIDLVDTLVCLDDSEWKFLPLWAGGNDDGTGGVFEEAVPDLEAGGWRGGKRGIGQSRTSMLDGSASSDSETYSSGFDDVGSSAVSTVNKASKVATDGEETIMSMSDTSGESEDFMGQKGIWDAVMEMKVEEAKRGKANQVEPAVAEENRADDDSMMGDDEGDVSTILGANSDVGDHCFEDVEDDDEDKKLRQEADIIAKDEAIGGSSATPVADLAMTQSQDEDTDDLEIIDKDTL